MRVSRRRICPCHTRYCLTERCPTLSAWCPSFPGLPQCVEISWPPSSSTAAASPPAARWCHTATCGGSRSRWKVWWRPWNCCRRWRGKIQNSFPPGLKRKICQTVEARGKYFILATGTYPGTKWVQRTMQLGRDREFEIRQTLLSMLLLPELEKTLIFTEQ